MFPTVQRQRDSINDSQIPNVFAKYMPLSQPFSYAQFGSISEDSFVRGEKRSLISLQMCYMGCMYEILFYDSFGACVGKEDYGTDDFSLCVAS